MRRLPAFFPVGCGFEGRSRLFLVAAAVEGIGGVRAVGVTVGDCGAGVEVFAGAAIERRELVGRPAGSGSVGIAANGGGRADVETGGDQCRSHGGSTGVGGEVAIAR